MSQMKDKEQGLTDFRTHSSQTLLVHLRLAMQD